MKKLKYLKLIIVILVFISCKKKVVIDSVKGLENTKSTTSQEALPEIHFYGETLPIDLAISDSIAKQFGFKLKRIGGDVLNEEMILSAKNNNQKTLLFLNKKYGENWRGNFEKQTGKKLNYYLLLE